MRDFKTQEEVEEEIIKCCEDPHYFATNYIKVKNGEGKEVLFKTSMSKEMFNEFIKTKKNKI
jgi:HEPN domain-containing protein